MSVLAAVQPTTDYEGLRNYVIGGQKRVAPPAGVPQEQAKSARIESRPGEQPSGGKRPIPTSSQHPDRKSNVQVPYARLAFVKGAYFPTLESMGDDIVPGDIVFVHRPSNGMGNDVNRSIRVCSINTMNELLARPGTETYSKHYHRLEMRCNAYAQFTQQPAGGALPPVVYNPEMRAQEIAIMKERVKRAVEDLKRARDVAEVEARLYYPVDAIELGYERGVPANRDWAVWSNGDERKTAEAFARDPADATKVHPELEELDVTLEGETVWYPAANVPAVLQPYHREWPPQGPMTAPALPWEERERAPARFGARLWLTRFRPSSVAYQGMRPYPGVDDEGVSIAPPQNPPPDFVPSKEPRALRGNDHRIPMAELMQVVNNDPRVFHMQAMLQYECQELMRVLGGDGEHTRHILPSIDYKAVPLLREFNVDGIVNNVDGDDHKDMTQRIASAIGEDQTDQGYLYNICVQGPVQCRNTRIGYYEAQSAPSYMPVPQLIQDGIAVGEIVYLGLFAFRKPEFEPGEMESPASLDRTNPRRQADAFDFEFKPFTQTQFMDLWIREYIPDEEKGEDFEDASIPMRVPAHMNGPRRKHFGHAEPNQTRGTQRSYREVAHLCKIWQIGRVLDNQLTKGMPDQKIQVNVAIEEISMKQWLARMWPSPTKTPEHAWPFALKNRHFAEFPYMV